MNKSIQWNKFSINSLYVLGNLKKEGFWFKRTFILNLSTIVLRTELISDYWKVEVRKKFCKTARNLFNRVSKWTQRKQKPLDVLHENKSLLTVELFIKSLLNAADLFHIFLFVKQFRNANSFNFITLRIMFTSLRSYCTPFIHIEINFYKNREMVRSEVKSGGNVISH